VTRQSINVLLQDPRTRRASDQARGGTVGKTSSHAANTRGRRKHSEATVAVRSVEVRMLAGMTEAEQSGAFRIMQGMIHPCAMATTAHSSPRHTARRPDRSAASVET